MSACLAGMEQDAGKDLFQKSFKSKEYSARWELFQESFM
ncbi:hypothetical protein FHR87_000018 [Azomonas macrocytogenes]|uniref:Uncharacterized protein n=1 Tax=Azomonas macrocytogenes TaxID=69962 RepID=A0A839SXL4_AZOMA|nr:hypothetical protein [Azomonas macrocytogenes]